MKTAILARTKQVVSTLIALALAVSFSAFATAAKGGGGADGAGQTAQTAWATAADVYKYGSTYPYPWSSGQTATGDYIADSYGLPSGHVIEDVTQERLLDILSSPEGDAATGKSFYILFGGPQLESTQKLIADINARASALGITKVYHFNPYLDAYQADILTGQDLTGSYDIKVGSNSITALWTKITDLLPLNFSTDTLYEATDTLLVRYNRAAVFTKAVSPDNHADAVATPVNNYYTLTQANAAAYTAGTDNTAIDTVFKGGTAAAIPAAVRTQYAFYSNVYDAYSVAYNTGGTNRLDQTEAAEAGLTPAFGSLDDGIGANAGGGNDFKFKQISFGELQNLYATPGEHIIYYFATWCGDTYGSIHKIAQEAAKSSVSTVYVYDTTLGNQQSYGNGLNSIVTSGAFNSRNNASSQTIGTASYIYAYAVRPLGQFVTENQSGNNTSSTGSAKGIAYYPDGDIASGTLTSNAPVYTYNPAFIAANKWDATGVNAIRLQLPHLVAYNKDVTANESHVVRTWIHKNANYATDGKVTEYMGTYHGINSQLVARGDGGDLTNGSAHDGVVGWAWGDEAILAAKKVLGTYVSGVTGPVAKTITVGTTTTLTASVQPAVADNSTVWGHAAAANLAVVWSSSNNAVATVSASGVVTGKAAGTASIVAKSVLDNSVSASATVTVKAAVVVPPPVTPAVVKAKTIKTPVAKINLQAGKSVTLPVVAYDANGKTVKVALKWKSNNKAVKVNVLGKIVAKKVKKPTKVTLTATDPVSGKKLKVTVTVQPKKVAIKKVTAKVAATLKVGKTAVIKTTLSPKNATAPLVTFKSSGKGLTVDKAGKVTAVRQGKYSVTIKAGNKKVVKKITVK